jgi:glutathione S-transferase
MNAPHLVLCELIETGLPRLESWSPFCLKVHRALALTGFAYETRRGNRPDAFRDYNPAGQVPVLLVDGRPVCDSAEIVSRLDLFSGGALTRGLDRRARAEAFLWEEMADRALSRYLGAARWLDEDNWPRTRAAFFGSMAAPARVFVPERIRTRVTELLAARDVAYASLDDCWARFDVTLDELEARAPVHGFWMGDLPCRADIAIFSQLWSFRTALTPRQAALLAARPRLSAWLERVDAACDGDTVAPAITLPPRLFSSKATAFA